MLFDDYVALLSPRTRLVAIAHVSNALGTVLPIRRMIAAAHERGAPVLIDGAQAVPHSRVDVRALDADFYAFSSHKLYGPTGVGVLYAREKLLAAMPPWQGGGDMIRSVTFEKTTYQRSAVQVRGGYAAIFPAPSDLARPSTTSSRSGSTPSPRTSIDCSRSRAPSSPPIPGVELVGTAPHKAAVVSFTMSGVHPHDIGTILDHEGIAIRTGHHCAMPVMEFFARTRHRARILRLLQHGGGCQRARRRRVSACARCSPDGPQGALSRRDPRPQPRSHETSGAWSRPTRRPRATTRSAAIACPLFVRMDGDRIEDLRFEGKGCAISTASASLMTEAVKGKSARRAPTSSISSVHELLTRSGMRSCTGTRQACRTFRRARISRRASNARRSAGTPSTRRSTAPPR